MKNLKRILSLALASVMVMGMMVVGASAADFEDQDQIQYTEAVAVLKALKVMQGNPDGTLDPKGELTRAQAATLLSILMNKGVAPNYGLPTNPIFNDVRGTNDAWAEQYINYCYNLGAVNGVGGGKYDPSATLNSTTWARMILNVLGIKLESATNWELMTEIQARDKDVNLYAGLDEITDTHAAITREQAAQMMFNGIKYAPESTGSSYVVKDGDKIVYQGTDPITALLMQQAKETNTLELVEDLSGSILSETFGVTSSGSTDPFGRTTTTYKQGTKTIATIGDEAAKTYTAAVTSSQIYNDLGLNADATAKHMVNGTEKKDYGDNNDEALPIEKADVETTVGGNGSTVEVYYDGTNITVVQIDTFAAVVTKVNEAKAATATTNAEKASVNVTVKAAGTAGADLDIEKYVTSGYEEDDVVLVTGTFKDGAMTIRSMKKAPFVVGTVSAQAKDYIRVDGEKYVLSSKNGDKATIGTTAGYKFAGASEYSYYLDNTGNIILAVVGAAAEDNSQYIYVLDVAAKEAKGTGNDLFETTAGEAAVAQAQVLDLETGAVSIKNIAVVKHTDGKYYYANRNGEAGDLEVSTIPAGVVGDTNHDNAVDAMDIDDTFYKYVELDNGDIVLTAGVENAEITVEQNKAELGALDTGYANNTTKVTIYEKDSKGNISSKGYTGIANFPAIAATFKVADDDTATALAVMYKANTSKLVTDIIVVRNAVAEASTANYAIYAGVGETDSNGTAYSFYVDGELKSYYAKEGVTVTLTEGDVANLTFEGTKLSAVAEATDVRAEETTVDVAQAEYFVATKDGTTTVYYFTDNCVIVDAGDDYKTAEIAKGDKVTIYGADKDHVAFIVIAK